MAHTSVLLHESIDGLAIHEGDTFVDATLGDAGHSAEVRRRFDDKVTIVGIDRDSAAIDRAEKTLGEISANPGANAAAGKTTSSKTIGKIILKQGNFRNVGEILASAGLANANRFLFDIGLSSRQLEESGRGFSFQKNEPLLMTFETVESSAGNPGLVTAKEVVNDWSEQTLIDILKGFGEEKFARGIARGISEARRKKSIETTGDLVEIILASTPFRYHHGRIHPATRTFQAIRMAVNDELGAIRDGLKSAWERLSPGGRIAVISFHSLEDRIVKRYFNELKATGGAVVITKKPIIATQAEIAANPRSRSAKLRIIEKKI